MAENGLLTDRQLEILSLACYTNCQIAAILGLSSSTVKNHFSEIYHRLCPGCGTGGNYRRNLAVARALRLGLLSIEDISDGDRATFVRGRGWVFPDGKGGWQSKLNIVQRPKRWSRPARSRVKTRRNLEVAHRRNRGDEVADIANDFGVSTQRVYQICRQAGDVGND